MCFSWSTKKPWLCSLCLNSASQTSGFSAQCTLSPCSTQPVLKNAWIVNIVVPLWGWDMLLPGGISQSTKCWGGREDPFKYLLALYVQANWLNITTLLPFQPLCSFKHEMMIMKIILWSDQNLVFHQLSFLQNVAEILPEIFLGWETQLFFSHPSYQNLEWRWNVLQGS